MKNRFLIYLKSVFFLIIICRISAHSAPPVFHFIHQVLLPAGTSVPLESKFFDPANVSLGEVVELQVAQNIGFRGTVLIGTDTRAIGQIISIEKKKEKRDGQKVWVYRIVVEAKTAWAVDGQEVNLFSQGIFSDPAARPFRISANVRDDVVVRR